MEATHDQATLLRQLKEGEFAFLDMGCGDGGSIAFCQDAFGRGRGMGVEVDAGKVEIARREGLPVIEADISHVDLPVKSVSFCSMMDFLEHVRPAATPAILQGAMRVARDFLYIRHPSFDEGEYLESLGLRLSWTHWSGHRNPMTLPQLTDALEAAGARTYVVVPRKQLLDSTHPSVVPLGAPEDTVAYEAELHGPKPYAAFGRPIWQQYDIAVRLDGDLSTDEWQRITEALLQLARTAVA